MSQFLPFSRRLAVGCLLFAGCSTPSLFSGRETQDRNSVDEAYAQQETAGRETPKRPKRKTASASDRKGTSPDTVQRRQLAEALTAAVRAEKAQDAREARVQYERVLALDPQHSFAHYQLAILADNARQFAEAERHYRTLLQQDPKNADVLASLGWSYFMQGRLDDSERTLKRALEIAPDHATALYNLGWVTGKRGNYEQALALLRRAGSEQDARNAMAELFPQGPPGRAVAASPVSSRNDTSRAPDVAGTPPIVAPAPTRSGKAEGTPRVRPAADSPFSAPPIKGDQQLEQVFAQLELQEPEGTITQAAATQDAVGDTLSIPPNAFDNPPAGNPRMPVIRPKGREAVAAGASPASPGSTPATPAGQLPEWPGRPSAPATPAARPSATTAALWGLTVGPGGLPFAPLDAASP